MHRRLRSLLAPLGALPWEVVIALWLGLQLAALWYIGREWALALIVFPPVWLDLVYGNINIDDRGGNRGRLPLPGSVGVPAADQGHPGRRRALVRRPARVALAGDGRSGVTGALALGSIVVLGTGDLDGLDRGASRESGPAGSPQTRSTSR